MIRLFRLMALLLLAPLSGSAGGPDPASAPVPEQVAAVEHGAQGARLVVLQVASGRVHWAGEWRQDAMVDHPSWSADGAFLLYRQGDVLLRHTMGKREATLIAEVLAMPSTTSDYALSPEGREVALVRADSIELLAVGAESSPAANSRRVAMPPGCRPYSMQWQPEGKVLQVLCLREGEAEGVLLVEVNPATATATPRAVRGVERLLGRSRSHGLLVSGAADESGQRPGTLAEDGAFTPLRPAPAAGESTSVEPPPIDFVQGYLPSIDRFVMARASEDPGDPVVLTLVPPGIGPARRWLKAFSRVGSISYGVPGPWIAFINRKPADRGDVGDLYIVRAGREDARLVARSNARRGTFYASPVPRPRKTSETRR